MGFSYAVAVVILLSSSLIFFGLVYNEFETGNIQLNNSLSNKNKIICGLENSHVSITNYSVKKDTSGYNIIINMSNNGSTTLIMANSNVLLNGTQVAFNYSENYFLPFTEEEINATYPSGNVTVIIAFSTGYEKYLQVVN
ncbi:flagellar protein F [mine drainage metagenome]|uniref:Flagellar protein F n=1 Tax=mine drainage metagenome TaxID=410659 RepID=T0ZQ26_9ZZZZ